jgi:hypothetical protein
MSFYVEELNLYLYLLFAWSSFKGRRSLMHSLNTKKVLRYCGVENVSKIPVVCSNTSICDGRWTEFIGIAIFIGNTFGYLSIVRHLIMSN